MDLLAGKIYPHSTHCRRATEDYAGGEVIHDATNNSVFSVKRGTQKDMQDQLVVSYLSTIVQNKHLPMLEWRHGSSISVEVWICRG